MFTRHLATHIEQHSIYQPHAHPHYLSCTHTKKFAGIHSNEAILQVTSELCNFETHIKKKNHKPYSHPTEINPTYIYKANKRELTQFRQLENQINLEKLPPWRSWWWTWASSCTNRRSTPTTNRRPSKRTTSSSWRWTERKQRPYSSYKKSKKINKY